MLITYLGVDRLLRAEDALDGDGDDGAPDAALLPAEKQGKDSTYTSVCRGALGPRYETLACALIWLCSVSSCVAYATFVADNGARFAGGPRWAWAAALDGCALPGALFLGDRLDSLRWCNAAGLGLGVRFSGLVVGKCGRRFGSLAAIVAALRRDAPTPAEAAANLPVAAGIAVFCNEGIVALASSISRGASSSQSSGFDASGSSILAASTQSFGLESSGSSISLGGVRGGSKASISDPEKASSSSI